MSERVSAPLDRTRPPRAAPAPPFHFPDFERLPLAAGLELFVAAVPTAPLALVELIWRGGAALEPPNRTGLGTFTAHLLDDGTAGRTGPEIAALVERLGGSLQPSASWDATYVSCEVLAKDVDTALALVAEITQEPTFPDDEVTRFRHRRLAEILRRKSRPAALAGERFVAAVYGEGPYSYPLLGRREDVEEITSADPRRFFAEALHGGPAAVVVAGDVDPETIRRRCASLFSPWPARPPIEAPEIRPRPQEGPRVEIVDRPRAAQTELRVGHAGPPRTHPDWIPLAVMSSLLGGKFTSRINLNLRERHGFTYGAHTSFSARLGPGPFTISTSVANEVVGPATIEIFNELRRIRDDLVTTEELDDTVGYLEGVFPYTLQTVDDLASRLASIFVYGFPDDYYDGYRERLRAVTREDVLRVAREHLRPDAAVVATVGPETAIRPQLESFG